MAEDLAVLRMVQALPIPGVKDFLHVLQLRLRNQPGMAEKATELRAVLPEMFAEAIKTMDRLITGEERADDAESADEPEEAEMAAALAALPPEQRAEMQVFSQVFPTFQQAAQVLHSSQATAMQRLDVARNIDGIALQAAEGEVPGSPWLDAAAGLRALAMLLRGIQPNYEALTPVYRQLVEKVRDASAEPSH